MVHMMDELCNSCGHYFLYHPVYLHLQVQLFGPPHFFHLTFYCPALASSFASHSNYLTAFLNLLSPISYSVTFQPLYQNLPVILNIKDIRNNGLYVNYYHVYDDPSFSTKLGVAKFWAMDGRSEFAGKPPHQIPSEGTLFIVQWQGDNCEGDRPHPFYRPHYSVFERQQDRVHRGAAPCPNGTHLMCLDNNNITSVGVIRKAAWPRLSWLRMEYNYFKDANSLVHGCFPQMKLLNVYYDAEVGNEKNGFTDRCFPAKIQAGSLKYLCIRKRRFCFDRCLKRVLHERWSEVKIQR